MPKEDFKYSHARIVPTVIVLIVSFLLFGFIVGYNWGFSNGGVEGLIPLQKCPDSPLFRFPQKKPMIPAPADSSGYIFI